MVGRWHELPEPLFRGAATEGAVLLHSAKPDERERVSWLYTHPVATLSLDDPAGIDAFLGEAEANRAHGRWLAGWVGYEAGYPLVGVADPAGTDIPAAWFGVYDGAWRFDHRTGEIERVGEAAELPAGRGDGPWSELDARPAGSPSRRLDREPHPEASRSTHPEASSPTHLPRFGPFGLTEDAYRTALERIHAYLSAGDTYQVNFTDRFEAEFGGDLLQVFRALCASQPVSYAAFVNATVEAGPAPRPPARATESGGHRSAVDRDARRTPIQIASLSPELFFCKSGRTITTRPMKGTAPRGRDNAEDAALADALRADEKTRAENVMIVDLLRNDLGRVCEHGSVRVPYLFDVERYRTVQQMTSTVTGKLRAGVGLKDLFGALFPCGSVTGAPKRRTMQIIRELERGPRGVYTGAIGHASPDGDMAFSVAIRTLVGMPGPRGARFDAGGEERFDGSAGPTDPGTQPMRVVLGAGGGIVADSDPDAEYRECALKARFATDPGEPFELIETIRWEGGYRLLEAHLDRLRASAEYFGFALDVAALRAALIDRAETLDPGTAHRIGIRLPASGAFRVTAQPFQAESAHPLRVALSEQRVDSRDPFLRHKTTRRALYDSARERAAREGLADVLFLNERSELAEGAISNVFLEIGGELLTPPLDAGALPGVLRGHLLATDPRVREATLTGSDLARVDRILLCSALRGLREATLAEAPQTA